MRGHLAYNCWHKEENADKRPQGWKPKKEMGGSGIEICLVVKYEELILNPIPNEIVLKGNPNEPDSDEDSVINDTKQDVTSNEFNTKVDNEKKRNLSTILNEEENEKEMTNKKERIMKAPTWATKQLEDNNGWRYKTKIAKEEEMKQVKWQDLIEKKSTQDSDVTTEEDSSNESTQDESIDIKEKKTEHEYEPQPFMSPKTMWPRRCYLKKTFNADNPSLYDDPGVCDFCGTYGEDVTLCQQCENGFVFAPSLYEKLPSHTKGFCETCGCVGNVGYHCIHCIISKKHQKSKINLYMIDDEPVPNKDDDANGIDSKNPKIIDPIVLGKSFDPWNDDGSLEDGEIREYRRPK